MRLRISDKATSKLISLGINLREDEGSLLPCVAINFTPTDVLYLEVMNDPISGELFIEADLVSSSPSDLKLSESTMDRIRRQAKAMNNPRKIITP